MLAQVLLASPACRSSRGSSSLPRIIFPLRQMMKPRYIRWSIRQDSYICGLRLVEPTECRFDRFNEFCLIRPVVDDVVVGDSKLVA